MVKGSTPTFTIKLPVHTDTINYIQAVFVQENTCSLIVETDRMVLDGNFASFTLKEWETLEFAPGVIADIQFSLSTKDGNVYVYDIRKIAVQKKYPEDIF